MVGLPLLRPPTSHVGGGGIGSAGSNFSTRVSSRQSNSQSSYKAGPAAALVSRGTGSTRTAATGRQGANAPTALAAVGRGSSALLIPQEELLVAGGGEVQEHELQGHQDIQVPRRVQRSSTSGRRADTSSTFHHDSASASDAQQGETGRNTTLSSASAQQALEGLPVELHCLLDASAPAVLPAPGVLDLNLLDNSRLDRLVAALGRGRATWRRALMLYDWLKASAHTLDDRLCTTLIRVCADHGDAVSALGVYEWMRSPAEAGGAALQPTAYTYTAAMRAALGVGMLDRAMQVWSDSQSSGLTPDCRLCITYIEVCTRLGMADKALAMYTQMRDAPPGSPMRPSVHAYTAAMRAATEGGRWMRALGVWEDMRRSGCQPTGHAYAAAISACAAGQDWGRAIALFDDMTSRAGIRPDVVSCTALVSALASAGEADKAEAVVAWMQKSGLKPNVRTYTALLTAMGKARQWQRAVRLLFAMQHPDNGSVQPNAYTYSALLKALGEHGQWQLAEAVFIDLETQVRSGRFTDALGNGTRGEDSHHGSERGAGRSDDSHHHGSERLALAVLPPTAAEVAQRAQALKRLLAVAVTAEAAEAAAGAGAAQAAALQQLGTLGMLASGALGLQQLAVLQQAASAAPAAAGGWGSYPASGPVPVPTASIPQQVADEASLWGAAPLPSPAMSTNSPSTNPASPLTSNPASSLFTSTPGSGSPTTPMLASSVRNWSHPSQLNGIQLDLLRPAATSASELPLPAPPSPIQQAAPIHAQPQPSPQSSSAARPAWLAEPNQDLSAGQYSYSSTITPMTMLTPAALASPGPHSPASPATTPAAVTAAPAGFSLFSSQPTTRAPPAAPQQQPGRGNAAAAAAVAAAAAASGSAAAGAPGGGAAGAAVVNEVVCNALMLAYERAGKWTEAVAVISRARLLGVVPSTVMFNTAISAAGRAGQLEVAEQLFNGLQTPDMGSYEAMLAAYGMAGRADKAEHMVRTMVRCGLRLRDYAFCGLITAHSMAGSPDAALAVRQRMRREGGGVQMTVHVYNALLAACERAARYEQALELLQAMKREGIEPNSVTHHLMAVVGRHGVQTVESQQVAAAALSAVFAAAGGLLIRAGMW